jgi:hypothetical protein
MNMGFCFKCLKWILKDRERKGKEIINGVEA